MGRVMPKNIYTEEDKKNLVKQYLNFSGTKEGFCAIHTLSPSSLYRWIKQYGNPRRTKPPKAPFAPVIVTDLIATHDNKNYSIAITLPNHIQINTSVRNVSELVDCVKSLREA